MNSFPHIVSIRIGKICRKPELLYPNFLLLVLLLFIGLNCNAHADNVLHGRSPAIFGSIASLSIGSNSVVWSSNDTRIGGIDTGLVVPSVWRQSGSSTIFMYQNGTLRLYGQSRANGDTVSAIVDVIYNLKRVRYILTELESGTGDDPDEPYPPYPPEEPPMVLNGRVFVADDTGFPIFGAIVSIAGKSSTTDSQGAYLISDISAGNLVLTVSKEGYNNFTESLVIKKQTTVRNVALTAEVSDPNQPVITAVKPQYEGIFLDGISLKNRYDVSVQWNGNPGNIKFDVNGTEYVVPGNQDGGNRVFDMGLDFVGNVVPSGNTLTITAVNEMGVESQSQVFHPVVIPVPPWSQNFGPWTLTVEQGEDGVDFGLKANFPDPAIDGIILAPNWVPIVGGKKTGLKETQLIVGLKFSSSGKGSISAGGKTGFTVAGNNLEGTLLGTGTLRYKPNIGMLWVESSIDIKIAGKIEPPSVPLSNLIVPGSGIVARILRPILSAKIESEFSPVLTAVFTLEEKNNEIDFKSAELGGGLSVKISLVFSAGPAEASLYGGGDSKFTVQLPADPSLLKQILLKLYAGVEVKLWIFTKKVEAAYKWSYPETVRIFAESLQQNDNAFAPIQPDFLRFGPYSVFGPNAHTPISLQSDPELQQVSAGSRLIENVYPHATPAIAEQSGNRMVAFVYYDVEKAPVQATDIYYSYFDGLSYSEPAAILDDTCAEFDPQLGFDANGRVMAVWERVKDPNFAGEDIDTMAPLMEIVYALYTPEDGSWSEPMAITDNLILDHGPLLRSDETGRLLLVWEQNSGNQIYGDTENPSRILYAIWDGSNWNSPATVLDSLVGAFDFDASFWADGGILTWSQDIDADVATRSDREIFYTKLDSSSWTPPQRLTDDNIADTAPQVIGTGTDSVQLLWRRGDQYVELTDLQSVDYGIIREDSGVELDTARLVSGPAGSSYLIWQTLKDGHSDIYYRVKSANHDLWGEDTRLTDDDALEKHIAVAVSSTGILYFAFNKAETLYETLTVDTAEGQIEVGEVPQPGRNDLYVLSHAPFDDLAVIPDSFALSDASPAPGTEVTLGVTVRNNGDRVIDTFRIAFYDGTPSNSGVEIETQTVNALLRPGTTYRAEVPWLVPNDRVTHVLYVLADPSNAIVERDESNNSAFFRGLLPDVVPVQTSAHWRGDDTLEFIATVANNGTSTAVGVIVELRKNDPDGDLLKQHILTALEAGSQTQVPFTWQADPDTLQSEDITLYVVTDPDDVVPELNEGNNTRAHLVLMP